MFFSTLALLLGAVTSTSSTTPFQSGGVNQLVVEDTGTVTDDYLPYSYVDLNYSGLNNQGISSQYFLTYTDDANNVQTYKYLSFRGTYYQQNNEFELNFIKGTLPVNMRVGISVYTGGNYYYLNFDYLYRSNDEDIITIEDENEFTIYLRFYLYNQEIYESFTGSGNTFDSAYEYGHEIGYNEGYDDGVNDFKGTQEYQDDIDNAWNSGKNTGYYEGLHTQTYTFSQLFGAIADTPILIMSNLLGFDVFGVSALSIVMTMLTGCIVFYLIKRIIL